MIIGRELACYAKMIQADEASTRQTLFDHVCFSLNVNATAKKA